MRISEAFTVGTSNKIQWNESELKVSDRLKSTRMTILKIYKGQDLREDNLIGQSIPIQVNGEEQVFLLRDVFNQHIFWQDSMGRSVCFVLSDERTQQPLDRACSIVRRQIKGEASPSRSNSNAAISLEGEMLYELSNNYASLISNDQNDLYHIASANGKVSVKGIPFNFSGQYSNADEPFLQHNLNQFTTYYDPTFIRSLLQKKAEKVLATELEKKKEQYPELTKMQSRYSSISNLLANPTANSEIKELQNIQSKLEDFSVSDLSSLLNKSDSLSGLLATRKIVQDKLQQMKSNVVSERRDSVLHALDSCRQTIQSLAENIQKADHLETLLQKQNGYEQVLLLKDSCEQYLEKSKGWLDAYQKNKEEILRNPASVRNLLKENNLLSSKENILSKISKARIGVIHPSYSSLSMQNIRQSGVDLGIDNDTWNIEAFVSKSQQQAVALNGDSVNLNQIKLLGSQIGFSHGASAKTALFFAYAYDQTSVPNDQPRSHMGIKNEVTVGTNKYLKSELVWSANNYDNGEKERASLSKSLKEMAMKIAYQENGKSLNWKMACEYLGPNYKDFYNPFIRSNSINLTLNGNVKVSKYGSIGLNSIADVGNIWSSESFRNSMWSVGGYAAIHNPNWPSIIYTNQITLTQSDIYDFVSNWHMLSSSMTYEVKDISWTSSMSAVYSNQTATLDSSAYTSMSVQFFHNLPITESFQLEFSGLGNFIKLNQSEKINEWQASMNLLYAGAKVRANVGIGLFDEQKNHDVGFEIGLTYSVWKNLTGQVSWNNLRRPTSLHDNAASKVRNYFQMRLNYRF